MPTSLAVSRLTLLPASGGRPGAADKVRRYRLARVAQPQPGVSAPPRYAYLKRMYD